MVNEQRRRDCGVILKWMAISRPLLKAQESLWMAPHHIRTWYVIFKEKKKERKEDMKLQRKEGVDLRGVLEKKIQCMKSRRINQNIVRVLFVCLGREAFKTYNVWKDNH